MLKDERDEDQRFALLMRSAQNGDAAVYRELLGRLTPLLRRLIRREQPAVQWDDVEDLVQDILLALHYVRATYNPERPFLLWLVAIARHRMTDGAHRYARGSANEVTVEHFCLKLYPAPMRVALLRH